MFRHQADFVHPLRYVIPRAVLLLASGYLTKEASVSTICCDFFYAIFPWFIVRGLQMPNREKYTIAGSFSLGLM